jgi:FAD:protein FMN transferase
MSAFDARFLRPAILALALTFSQTLRAGDAELGRYEYKRLEMGMPFQIVFYAPDDDVKARAAVDAAYARVKQLNAIMSDYDDESELSRLSATAGKGGAVKVSDDLWRVLAHAQDAAARSDGAFDVTVGPIVQLWRKARRAHQLPPAELLDAARARVGYKNLRLDPVRHTAELLAPGMLLDLGAIAKGDAADQALKVLRARGITRAFAGAGGDMAFGDPPPGKPGWRIELAQLDAPDAPPAGWILLANCAMATSGDMFQRVEIDGRRYSHIVDPHTGVGLTDHSLVVVVAPDGITADALSTAVSVLGPERGVKLIEDTNGAAARIVRKPGDKIEVVESSRWRDVPSEER